MATMLGSLLVSLGLESAQFKRDLRGAKNDVSGFSKFAKAGMVAVAGAATAAAGALTLMVRNSINVADEISKAAQAIGIGTEELSRLRYAADLSGVSFEQLQTGVGRLSRNMLDASRGLAAPARAFEQLGISVTNADGTLKSATDIMGEVADRFSTMEDGAEKTALAMEIFGRAGADLIPMLNGGRDAIAEMTAEADKFGIVIDAETGRKAEAFNDNLTRLQGAFGALATQIAAEMLPALIDLTNWLVQNASAIRAFAGELSKAAQGIVFMVNKAIDAGRALRDFFAPAVDAAARALRALGLGGTGGNSTLDVINALKAAAAETAPPMLSMGGAADSAGRSLVKGLGGGARAASAAMKPMRDEIADLIERLFPELTSRADRAALALLDAAEASGKISAETRREGRLRVLGAAGPATVSRDVTNEGPLDAVRKVNRAGQKLLEQMERELSPRAKKAADSVAESFGQMADRTLQALDRMVGAIRGGGFLDILSGVLNFGLQLGGMGVFGKSVQANINKGVPGFAGGTRFAPGGMAMVGERGPELVNLPRGSQVIPNRELRGMGGMTINVDARGSSDPEAVRQQVQRGILEAAPSIVAAAEQRTISTLRRPRLAGAL